nr:MAG TPA: hypothetical protein [Caudoviricetes sp.]
MWRRFAYFPKPIAFAGGLPPYQIFRRPVVFFDNGCIIQTVTLAGLFARPKDMNF